MSSSLIRPAQFNRPKPRAMALGDVVLRAGFQMAEEAERERDADLTLGAYLEHWLAESVRLSVRPKTLVSYRGVVTNHLIPALGAYRLVDLSPADVQHFLNAKSGAGLSPRTVTYLRNVLRQALGQAERTELVGRNVAKLALPPRIPRREVRPLTPDEARTFLGAIANERFEALFLIALACGLRQGEILGLRWSDIDLDAGTLTVRQALARVAGRFSLVETKSSSSRRLVQLPGLVVDALVRHQVRQAAEPAARVIVAPEFADLLFTTTTGAPIDGINVTRRFQRVLKAAGLPRQRFHDLRHACASLLLSQGVPARVVMETLGHSQISLTLNTYSHVIPALGREAAERMDAVLRRVDRELGPVAAPRPRRSGDALPVE